MKITDKIKGYMDKRPDIFKIGETKNGYNVSNNDSSFVIIIGQNDVKFCLSYTLRGYENYFLITTFDENDFMKFINLLSILKIN
jgi:hypothetical protein